MEKDPENRYQSAKELLVDVRRLGAPGTAAAVRLAAPTRARWRWPLLAGTALALAAGIAIGLNPGGLRSRLLHRAAGPPQIESVAVLPLENLSRDPDQDYFADGMTDVLITDLAKISALRVISRTSVVHYKGTKKTVPEIARELNVDAVIEGSVQKSSNRVLITAQLIQAATDRHLWADRYERDLSNVLALEGEVAQAIAREIRVKVAPQEKVQLASARAVNPDALQLYLRGRFYWNKRSIEGIDKAIDYMNQAIAKDPSYALAYAGLADCYTGGGRADFTKGKAAAIRALELDPLLAEPHAALAKFRQGEFDWAGAESEYKHAIELNPNYASGHQWYGQLLAGLGRLEEARDQIQMARRLDPLSLSIQHSVVTLYEFEHQFDRAIEELHKILEMDPNFPIALHSLTGAYETKGMYREAAAEWQKYYLVQYREAAAAGWENVTDEASYRRAVARVLALRKEQKKKEHVGTSVFLDLYLRLGDNEQALAWLEKAYQKHSGALLYLRMPFYYDPLRSDPRFQDLLRRIGLPP